MDTLRSANLPVVALRPFAKRANWSERKSWSGPIQQSAAVASCILTKAAVFRGPARQIRNAEPRQAKGLLPAHRRGHSLRDQHRTHNRQGTDVAGCIGALAGRWSVEVTKCTPARSRLYTRM